MSAPAPIDVAQLRKLASDGQPGDEVRVTRRWLLQAVGEIEAGRKAAVDLRAANAAQGLVFGLRPGQRI